MKTYYLSLADSMKHVPEHPERTARKQSAGCDLGMYYQVWTSRAAMLKTIEMQGKRAPNSRDWRACKIPARETT